MCAQDSGAWVLVCCVQNGDEAYAARAQYVVSCEGAGALRCIPHVAGFWPSRQRHRLCCQKTSPIRRAPSLT